MLMHEAVLAPLAHAQMFLSNNKPLHLQWAALPVCTNAGNTAHAHTIPNPPTNLFSYKINMNQKL